MACFTFSNILCCPFAQISRQYVTHVTYTNTDRKYFCADFRLFRRARITINHNLGSSLNTNNSPSSGNICVISMPDFWPEINNYILNKIQIFQFLPLTGLSTRLSVAHFFLLFVTLSIPLPGFESVNFLS